MDSKKIFVMFLMGIFMISMASALEFDNIKSYDPITREVMITNAYGLGDVIGKARLNTPLNVKVAQGYQKVAEFDIWAYQDYSDALKQFTLTDMKTKEKINRDYDLKYLSYEEVLVDDYNLYCHNASYENESIDYNKCENILIGSHYETKQVWNKITPANLKKNDVLTIGVFTDVQMGDYIDWIPTIYGVEVEEWATWTASLNVDILSSWNFNNDTLDGVAGANDGQGYGGTTNTTGILGQGLDFEESEGDQVDIGDNTIDITDGNFSINAWIKLESTTVTTGHSLVILGSGSTGAYGFYISVDNNKLTLGKQGVDESGRSTTQLGAGAWQMVTMVYDQSANLLYFYINGTADPSNPISYATTFTGGLNYSIGDSTGGNMDGVMDEVIVWTRALIPSEPTQLYNTGLAIGYTTDFGTTPNITLNSPSSANYTTYQNITINLTVWDDINLTDVKLYINDILNQTNASGINNSNYLFNLSLGDGNYTIYGKGTDNESREANSLSIQINIDTTPFIEFLTPPTLINNSNITAEIIPIGINTTTPYLQNITYSLRNVNGTNFTTTFTNTTYEYNFTNIPDAHYHYDVTICTTTDKCNITETRHINHDATDPILTSSYNLTDLLIPTTPVNSTWHYNASDENIDSCYYNTTESATYKIITCNATENTEWASNGYKTIQFCANDTFGNQECSIKNIWVVNYSQADDPDPSVEGFDTTFTLNLNATNIPTFTASLNINGSVYSSTQSISTNGIIFTKVLQIPATFGNATGVLHDWYWNISGNFTENTATTNITIYELAVDDCSSYGELIFNFSVLDEATLISANESETIDVEADLTLTSKTNSSQYLSYSNTWASDNNPQICVPIGVINNSQYWIDLTVGFSSTDHVYEFFYIDSGTLNSTKIYEGFNGMTDQDINLMDLLTADSTSFLFNYFDVDGLAVDGSVVHVMRKYIGSGEFLEVERAKQDQNGDTIVHLVEEDVIYYFMITKDGVLLYTSSTYTALCQATPCTIQIEASGGSATFPTDWDLVDGGAYLISSDGSTRDVTLTYSFNASDTINLTVYKYNSDGSYSAIDTAGDTGSSGSIVLNVPQSAGNVSFFASVIKGEDFKNSEWIDFESTPQDRFGVTLSLFLAGLIILTLGLFAIHEGAGTIAYIILGVMISGALGLMNTELSTGINIVIYLILAGGILLWKLTRGRS